MTTPARSAHRMTSTTVKRASALSPGILARSALSSVISLEPSSLDLDHSANDRERAPRRADRSRPSADRSRLGPDLLRVRADLEGLRVGIRVLVDRRCELAAFAILVA